MRCWEREEKMGLANLYISRENDVCQGKVWSALSQAAHNLLSGGAAAAMTDTFGKYLYP
jgi:hypothetical protein